jgi:acyltransferase
MSVASESARVDYVDVLRVVAAFQMVQGHTIDAVLAPAYRHGALHAAWMFMRGLTSVTFLTTAGIALYFAAFAEPERARLQRPRRVKRALLLIAMGYVLRTPWAAWRVGESGVAALHVVDILQCMGAAMLVIEGVAALRIHRYARLGVIGVLATSAWAFAPLTQAWSVTGAWGVAVAYVSPHGGSLFPLLPWSAHLFLGVLIGGSLRGRSVGRVSLGLWFAATGAVVCAYALGALGLPSLCGDHLLRAACVVFALSGCALWSTAFGPLKGGLRVVASQTLVIYVFHGLMVYGEGVGLSSLIGQTKGPVFAVILALGMVALSFLVAIALRDHVPVLLGGKGRGRGSRESGATP